MIKSMTGFGRAEGKVGNWDLSLELRAVNSRFLEVVTRSPRGLEILEDYARIHIQQQIPRGRIIVTLNLSNGKSELGLPVLDTGLLERYREIYREAGELLGHVAPPDPAILLALPDVIKLNSNPAQGETLENEMKALLNAAVAQLDQMRIREGEALATAITLGLEKLENLLQGIREQDAPRLPEVADRLRKRIQELGSEVKVQADHSRMEQEIVFWGDRLDIQEEIVRLGAHIDHFRELMAHPEDAGKRLNFLLQEMNREANTIGSKAYHTGIAHDVVEIKNEIECIRE